MVSIEVNKGKRTEMVVAGPEQTMKIGGKSIGKDYTRTAVFDTVDIAVDENEQNKQARTAVFALPSPLQRQQVLRNSSDNWCGKKNARKPRGRKIDFAIDMHCVFRRAVLIIIVTRRYV